MATIRIQNNILDNKVDTFSAEDVTIETLIREHTDGNVYNDTIVECYDPETGKTFYAPLVDDVESLNAIVQVNGKDASLDYVVKKNDIVAIVITPAGDGQTGSWNWWGALSGSLMMSLSWGLTGAAFGGGAFSWLGFAIGATLGGVVGFIAGGIVGGMAYDAIHSKGSSSSKGIDSEKLPDVRGATNQPLLDQNYPFVLGKHLVTPFVIGTPWNEISGDRGQNNYIHVLYAVGYAPLRLTDFKLGEMFLAHNQRWSGNSELKNIFHGALHGVDTESGSSEDKGDITNTWANNDITLEILQQGQNGETVDYGSVYPYAKIQQDINANVLYIADGSLEEIDQHKSITYKGIGLANGLRNNPIRFSEKFAKSVQVELDFQSGLYKSRSETVNSASSVKYYKIPLWTAIQWRAYSEDNATEDGNNAGDNIPLPTWNPTTEQYEQVTYTDKSGNTKTGDFRGWHSFKTINSINSSVYDCNARRLDIEAHTGNDLHLLVTGHSGSYSFSLSTPISHTAQDILDRKSLWNFVSGTDIKASVTDASLIFNIVETATPVYESGYPVGTQYTYTFDCSDGQVGLNDNWLNAEAFNLESLGGTNDDPEGINEIRCVTKVDLVEWARENLLEEGESDEVLAKKIKAYFFPGSNSSQSIEVRVVRISPCYLDETTSTSSASAFTFTDIFSWTTLTCEMLNGDKLNEGVIEQKRPLTENRMRKLCVVSLKAKTDNVDQLSNTIKQFSCIAQSFAPYYDDEQKKWIPENVSKIEKYYKPSVQIGPKEWQSGEEITEEQFYEDRQNGIKSIKKPAGNDFVPQLVNNAIRINSHIDSQGRYFIPYDDKENGVYKAGCDGTLNYCTNIVSSMFLLAGIGPHLGVDALGYRQSFYNETTGELRSDVGDFNLAALAKWNKELKEVTDGSVYGSNGYHYNEKGERVTHTKGEIVKMFFTANAYIYSAEQLENMLGKLAIAGRAVYTKDNKNRLTVIMDKAEKYPVALINQQNTLQSSYTISYEDLPSGLQLVFPDENDGYVQNELYCMADGEDYENPKGAIEQYGFNYVTNNYQQNSLGRYVLANRLLNHEVVTKKIGAEGASIGLGNLVLVQDDTMLLGTDNGGRITKLIEDDDYIYGFVINNTFKYTGEEEDVEDSQGNTVTKCKQGVVILQPCQYKEDRVITLRLAKVGTEYNVDDVYYKAVKGVTNTVLFENRISKTQRDGEDFFIFKPQVDNIVGFGIVGQITSTYRVIKIKPDAKHNYEFTLMKYQKELYEYGRVLPTFQNNMTIPDRSNEDSFALSNNITQAQLVQTVTQVNSQMQQTVQQAVDDITEGTTTSVPDAPVSLTCIAHEDGIELKPVMATNDLNNSIKEFKYWVKRSSTDTWHEISTSDNYYFFDRTVDQYPDPEDLRPYQFRVVAVNIYGNESLPLETARGSVNTSGYLWWSPQWDTPPRLTPVENGYNLVIDTNHASLLMYGKIGYKIKLTALDELGYETTIYSVETESSELFIPYSEISNHPLHPEKDYFTEQEIQVEVMNYNVISGSLGQEITRPAETTDYKSWTPNALTGAYYPSVSASKRQVSIAFPSQDNVYGNIKYKIRVKKVDESTWYTPDLESDCYESETSYRKNTETALETTATFRQMLPLTGQNMQSIQVDRYEIITKDGTTTGEHTSIVREYYVYNTEGKAKFDANYKYVEGGKNLHYLPELNSDNITTTPIQSSAWLEGGTESDHITSYVTPVLIDSPLPEATEYQYEIQAESVESGKTSPAITINVTVDANSVADLVDSAITQTKLADGCVTTDKIAAGAITAEQISATNILAKGATAGSMTTNGLIIPDSGFWASEPMKYTYGDKQTYNAQAGEFFVGNNPNHPDTGDDSDVNNTYLHYKKVNGIWTFFLKIQNIIMSAVATVVNGVFKVKQGNAEATPFMTVNPMTSADSDGTDARTVRVDGTVQARNVKVNGDVYAAQFHGISFTGKAFTAEIADTATEATRSIGGSWISAREHCVARQSNQTQVEGSSWNPVIGVKTWGGFWSMGTVGGESLMLSYDTDSNYASGNNTSAVINFPPAGASGTLALTSDTVASANNADMVDGYHASGDAQNMLFRCKRAVDVGVANDNGYWAGMCNINVDGSAKWWHILSMDWTGTDSNPADWCSQFLLPTQQGGIPKYRFNANGGSTAISSSPWKNFITEENIGSQTVANANTATQANKIRIGRPNSPEPGDIWIE